MYRTVCSDLTDINIKDYDMLIFFSPQGIKSLQQNFPDFKQDETKIGVLGIQLWLQLKKQGLKVDLMAPTKETPSMTMALEKYIKTLHK
jgi:uroporphyrinogen-III synthase